MDDHGAWRVVGSQSTTRTRTEVHMDNSGYCKGRCSHEASRAEVMHVLYCTTLVPRLGAGDMASMRAHGARSGSSCVGDRSKADRQLELQGTI